MINYTDLIGVPFKNRGRDVHEGLDCYGLVMEVYKRYGHQLPEYNADFDDTEKVHQLISSKTAIESNWKKVNMESLPVPCMLAIRFGTPPGVVNHTGCYIGNGRFIHIRSNIGVCIDHVNSPAWRKTIVSAYEFVGDKKP